MAKIDDLLSEVGDDKLRGQLVATVESETRRDDVVGWLRNPDRKPWSLCVPRKGCTHWVPFFPDFVFFRKVGDDVIDDIVDPHLLLAKNMPERAVWLANYANKHADQYGRIEMVIYESADDRPASAWTWSGRTCEGWSRPLRPAISSRCSFTSSGKSSMKLGSRASLRAERFKLSVESWLL